MNRSFSASGPLRSPLDLLRCRGCLGPLGPGAEAGLCGPCWDGLWPLPSPRCPRCALAHGDGPCPEPVAWSRGDALWDYHGGRPPLGALLVPGIKAGERGWKRALLRRFARSRLPAWCARAEGVCSVPTTAWKRWCRGFDLAEEAGRILAGRLGLPYLRLLRKPGLRRPQAGLGAARRRALPRGAIRPRGALPEGCRVLLLVDDVWTTGTSLLRSAQALGEGGAEEVMVLAMFRSF